MSEVKRWEPENTIVGFNMRPDAEGSFVLHDAYAKLEAEAQALREEVAALRARFVVPDGYALVPVEPTREMFIAVNKEDDKAYAGGCDHGAQFDWLWDAALEAAPRINGKAVSEGLLRRIRAAYDNDMGATLAEAIDELSALLGEGKEVGDVLVRE